tara:strand:+ start:11240 stop:11977 length:738 start_codon:yes stop_codon:yes gene_type:complete
MNYLNKHFETGITHFNTLKAATDTNITTLELIESAKQLLKEEKSDADLEDRPNLPLITLHYRAGDDLLNHVLSMITSTEPIDRELGCLIVKEFPSINDAPTKYSPRIISAIQQMINHGEDNMDVLISGLVAVGWQCHANSQTLFDSFIEDKRTEVRQVIADNLLNLVKDKDSMTPFVIDGFNRLGRDSEADVRWSIFYDISEHFELFEKEKDSFRQLILEGINDTDKAVQQQAVSAFDKLLKNVC